MVTAVFLFGNANAEDLGTMSKSKIFIAEFWVITAQLLNLLRSRIDQLLPFSFAEAYTEMSGNQMLFAKEPEKRSQRYCKFLWAYLQFIAGKG